MKLHLKIWIPALISVFCYTLAKSLERTPGPNWLSQATFWFWAWGILQVVAAYFAWTYLKTVKHRSGGWVGLVAIAGVLGIIIIYLIPAKKIIQPPTPQA
jgi:hypothetical protein